MEERTFKDRHGVDITTYWWTIPSPVGAVVIAHGASEHGLRYDRFAGALNDAGFAAVAVDHRGHGKTSAATGVGKLGPGGGQAVVDDLDELRAQLASEVGADVPMFLFGHSMGSLFGLAYLTAHSAGLRGGILCGFPADPNGADAIRELMKGLAEAGNLDEPFGGLSTNNAAFENPRTTYDWLSRDDAEVDKYIADKYCGDNHPLTLGYIAGFFELVADAADQLGSIQCPVFVIAGDQDPAAGMGAHPRALAEALSNAGVATDCTIYEGARHELLNETNRDEVTADVVAWLRKHA